MISSRTFQVLGNVGLLVLFLAQFSSLAAGARVFNNSPWTIRYTTDAGTNAPNLCHFWNWPSGGDKIVKCTQKNLAAGKTINLSTLDGFTYADRRYLCTGNFLTKGVWQHMRSGDSIRCVSSGGSNPYPICEVYDP
ncbi:hypothetical protein MMC22_009752 [Lobaria immixta]|nr:hypothetical protein [Lobaria immixta]